MISVLVLTVAIGEDALVDSDLVGSVTFSSVPSDVEVTTSSNRTCEHFTEWSSSTSISGMSDDVRKVVRNEQY